MFCMRCNVDLAECSCPDIDQRLKDASDSAHQAVKWCMVCDKHYARCRCEEPVFGIRTAGKVMATTMVFP
jgi:hypothetical protein